MGGNNQIQSWVPNPLGTETHDVESQVLAVNSYTQLLSVRESIQIQGCKTPTLFYSTLPYSGIDSRAKNNFNQLLIQLFHFKDKEIRAKKCPFTWTKISPCKILSPHLGVGGIQKPWLKGRLEYDPSALVVGLPYLILNFLSFSWMPGLFKWIWSCSCVMWTIFLNAFNVLFSSTFQCIWLYLQ